MDIVARVHEALTYERGITGWQATAAEVWERRGGVCRDFAHLTLGALRSVGIPARYVSGVPHRRGRRGRPRRHGPGP
uniref:Transglutaminase family protein n=1 Tax=Janibacter limosus TaxID=53458 RepID=A0AC61U190_9MICO|nr:transglutaminase family protein [Janibacter limosus]